MYCGTHDDVGCTACMALDHRTCSDVQFIPDVIGSLKITEETSKLRDSLKASKAAAEDSKTLKEKNLVELQKSKHDAIKSIKTFRKELEDLLAKIEETSIQEVEAQCVFIETSVKSELEEINDYVTNLEEAIRSLESVEGNKAQKFVCLKCAEKVHKPFNFASPTSSQARVHYQINAGIQNLLKSIRSFRQIAVVHRRRSVEKPLEIEGTCYRKRKTFNIDVKQKNEPTRYWISGSCFPEDGFMLIADYRNMKLKRVDVLRRCLKDHCDLPACPLGVCLTCPQEAVVCLSGNKVQFVSLGSTMKLSRQLKFKHCCDDVAYNNSELFISDSDRKVYVYNRTGGRWRTIAYTDNECIQRIAYEPTVNRLYVSAWDCLLIYDRNGKHVGTFRDPVIQGVNGVCSDGNGGVFICGSISKNVIYITEDGGKQELLGSQDLVEIEELWSLSFSKSDKMLSVTGSSGIIKLFKLREN